jgi:hypothetical protein
MSTLRRYNWTQYNEQTFSFSSKCAEGFRTMPVTQRVSGGSFTDDAPISMSENAASRCSQYVVRRNAEEPRFLRHVRKL